MLLLAHLSQADICRCLDGAVSEQTARHVRVCIFCAHRLGDAAVNAQCWERRGPLGRLVRVDPSRVVDELLADIMEEPRRHVA
jgi:hypothetical protein